MIKNATILRITKPSDPTTGGVVSYSPAATTLSIRALLSAPTRRQIFQLGSVIQDATAVLRVLTPELGALTIAANDQVEVRADGRDEQTYVVLHVIDTRKAGLHNIAAFLKEMTA